MTKKHLSILLTIIFISPLLIKATHFLYIHHETHRHLPVQKPEIGKIHHTCPVCEFKFVEFIDEVVQKDACKIDFPVEAHAFITKKVYSFNLIYLFYLRAPPIIASHSKILKLMWPTC